MSREFCWEFFSKKKVFAIVSGLWEIEFWASWENSSSTFYHWILRVARNILRKNFPNGEQFFLFVFRVGLKTFPNFGENISGRSTKSSFYVSKKHLEERRFFSKNWSLYTSPKKLRTLSKKNSGFGEILPARLSKWHFSSSDENLMKTVFF